MEQRLTRISRFLSYLLRHHPEQEGLLLDEHGWAVIDELLATRSCRKHGLDREILERVVAENDKQRFEVDDNWTKIRAHQGHTLAVRLDLKEATPPDFLYHGTASRNIPSIRKNGLHRGKRHHVHFSLDLASAKIVGSRHGRPVVLRIRAQEMYEHRHQFFLSGNGVWLTGSVPPEFIDFPDPEIDGKER
jgi:putative RNA 2'-phosphotransferase